MKQLRNKLKSQSGETIAETLVATLIAALALTMLAGAIASSVRVIGRGREKLDAYYTSSEEDGVITMDRGGHAGTVTITDKGLWDPLARQTIHVTWFANDEFEKTPVVSYRRDEE